jgi:ribose transport system permease protein
MSAPDATDATHATDSAVADTGEQVHQQGLRAALVRRLAAGNTIWIFAVLVLIVAVFSAMKPHEFATSFEARTVATNAAVLMVVAVGMTFVIVTAGIDLSVGSVLVFAGVLAAKVMNSGGGSDAGWGIILLGLLVALAAGGAWGCVNGFLIAKAKVPPLIVTLGTLGMALGTTYIITSGQDLTGVPTRLSQDIGLGRVAGIPWMVVIALAVTAVGGVVLTMTRFGRYTLAIGSNAEAARRVGIDVDLHLIKVYALQGMLAGLAGFLALAYFNTTSISGHSQDNLNAIAAVVIGGTSLFGGAGTVVGTAIGVFIPIVLGSGFVIVGVQSYWQDVAVGAVLIAAVYVDQLRRRSRSRR